MPRRQLSVEEVAEQLLRHEVWLQDPDSDNPFDATNADIPEDADLTQKDLSGANLQGAHFTRVNLTGTKLIGVKCDSATKFPDAILRNVDLTNSVGLNAAALAGADLTDAKLPEPIAGFEMLKTVEESSSQAKTLFISMLAACAYTWLTVGTTKDAGLLTDSTTSPLPIIATPIPIASFYFIAPILLLLLFAYFHISLQRLWDLFADLPAVFPDGVPVDKRAYPWLLNGIVRISLHQLRWPFPPMTIPQALISWFLAYCMVPLSLIVVWIRYFARHDWVGSALQCGLIILSMGLALTFFIYARAVLTRRREAIIVTVWAAPAALFLFADLTILIVNSAATWLPFLNPLKSNLHFLENPNAYIAIMFFLLAGYFAAWIFRRNINTPTAFGETPKIPLIEVLRPLSGYYLGTIFVVAILSIFTFGSIAGISPDSPRIGTPWMPKMAGSDPRLWVPKFWSVFRYNTFANFRGADVSKRPTSTGTPETSTAATLRNANLTGAMAEGAYIANGDFRSSNASHAHFDGANLRGADFENANLYGASFSGADLTAANLKNANLMGADLSNAKGLLRSQVESARLWQLAQGPDSYFGETSGYITPAPDYRMGRLAGLNLNDADLTGIDLSGFDLREALLFGAKLRGVNLAGTNLAGARVQLTDFRGARISVDQVKTLRGWCLGLFDEPILKALDVPDWQSHNEAIEHRQAGRCHIDGLSGNFENWTFAGSSLKNASVALANLRGARFPGADLDRVRDLNLARILLTDFRGAMNLNRDTVTNHCVAALALIDSAAANDDALASADFHGADLNGCDLSNADLNLFDFTNADLRNADLAGSDVSGAKLKGARLNGANVAFANLLNQELTANQVKQAINFEWAYLPPRIVSADLPSETNYINYFEDIVRGNFRNRNLQNKHLEGLDLSQLSFNGSDLRNSSLTLANLHQVEFGGANLDQVKFEGADIEWADFRSAKKLIATQFRQAINWSAAYFDPPLLADLGLPADHNQTLDQLATQLNIHRDFEHRPIHRVKPNVTKR